MRASIVRLAGGYCRPAYEQDLVSIEPNPNIAQPVPLIDFI